MKKYFPYSYLYIQIIFLNENTNKKGGKIFRFLKVSESWMEKQLSGKSQKSDYEGDWTDNLIEFTATFDAHLSTGTLMWGYICWW